MKYVIIGGVAGGASAAARLRRLSEDAEIIMFEKGEHISYANCGMPYYIGNTIEERKRRKTYTEDYDILLLSPGAEPVIPELPGIHSEKIFTLRNVSDCDKIKMQAIESLHDNAKAVIVGGGFIGLEMAENLHKIGYQITVVEKADHILTPVDEPIAVIAEKHLRDKGVQLITDNGISGFEENGGTLTVCLEDGQKLDCDLAVLSIGVRPNTTLAEAAGLEIGRGIKVNEYLQTSDERIFAVGDAIEFPHPVTGVPYCNFLAGPANAQARIAAMNMVYPESVVYQGSVSTAIAKIFDLAVASTGLNEAALQRAGLAYETVIVHPAAHATYYPGSTPMSLKLNFSMEDGTIYGAQAIGTQNIDKQIDIISLLLKHHGTIFDLVNSEHSYAPPFGSAKSPVMFAGMVAENIFAHLMNPIHVKQLDEMIDNEEEFFLLDVRELPEYKNGTIEGATRYSVDELREFLEEIPEGKKIVVFCEVGLRGYVASRILMQNGFEEVYNLIGGMRTYRLTGRHNVIQN